MTTNFEHIYWPKLKVKIKLCFYSNNFNSFSVVFFTASQTEQHIFLINHKINTFFKKNQNSKLSRMITYSDSLNFMFIRLFVADKKNGKISKI